jgi:hypothetical protein
MTLDNAIAELRRRNEGASSPLPLPSDKDVENAEVRLGIKLHPDYRRFLLKASDVVFSVLEPAVITSPGAHNDLFRMAPRAWDEYGISRALLPVCEDNGDYYCMTPDGRIVLWSHDMNSLSGAEWSNLATWIEVVWMFDYDG